MPSREIRWLFIILAAAALLRFTALGQESLWYDEAVSVSLASHPAWDLFSGKIHDSGNPPLYFALLHGWLTLLGSPSEAAARSLSALFGGLGILAAFVLARRWAGSSVALTTAALLTFSPMHIYLSQEARTFTLVILLTTLSFLFLEKLRSQPRIWDYSAYLIFSAALIYSHYYGFFVLLTQFVYLNLLPSPATPKRLRQNWIFLVVLVLFLPQIPVFLIQQATPLPKENSALHLLALPLNLTVGRTLVWRESGMAAFALTEIAILALIAAPLWRGLKASRRHQPVLWFWLMGIPLAVLIVTIAISPILVDRYLSLILPAYVMVLGMGLLDLRSARPKFFLIVLAALAMVTAISLARYYMLPQKDNWRGLCAYVKEHRRMSEPVLIYPDYVQIPYEYYSRDSTNVYPLPRALRNGSPKSNPDSARMVESLTAASGAWLIIGAESNLAGHLWPQSALPAMFPRSDEHDFLRLKLIHRWK